MEHAQTSARLIAFYLPQFHPIPENDEWWGKGFSEWTNLAKARPLFRGHVQPHIPADLGFYDLRLPETRIAQAEMARAYGIEGFCYWHYWFDGRRILERPFNEVLRSGEPDYPFCLAWANHSWTGVWQGCPGRTLIEQTYPGIEDYRAHFRALVDAFQDHRYITVDGKPVFMVFCPTELPEPREFTDCWRQMAAEVGLKGLHLVGRADRSWDPAAHGFDAAITNRTYPVVGALSSPKYSLANKIVARIGRAKGVVTTGPTVIDYADVVKYAYVTDPLTPDRYPVVVPNWDNTPRCGRTGVVITGSSPELFGTFLDNALDAVADRDADHRIVFVKSWNEWAEGNYLEPDIEHGTGFLEAIASRVLSSRD